MRRMTLQKAPYKALSAKMRAMAINHNALKKFRASGCTVVVSVLLTGLEAMGAKIPKQVI